MWRELLHARDEGGSKMDRDFDEWTARVLKLDEQLLAVGYLRTWWPAQ